MARAVGAGGSSHLRAGPWRQPRALDRAIAVVRDNGNVDGSTAYGSLAHGITKSLTELDTAMNRVSTVRGLAGDLLNQAQRMGNTLLVREEQVEAQRVAAEQGIFQQAMPAGRSFQLLRLRIAPHLNLVPEISGNRLLVSVRLLKMESGSKPQPCTEDASFELTLCA